MSNILQGSAGWAIAFGVLLAVLVVIVLALKSRGRRKDRDQGRSGHRLSIVETREIDEERKLLIVRCDGTDHLVLIGGGSDLLIKADLRPAETRVAFPPPLAPEPSFAAAPSLPAEPAQPRSAPAPASAFAVPSLQQDAFLTPPPLPPAPPLAGRPEPVPPAPPSPELQAFAPARAAPAAAPVADTETATSDAVSSPPDFSEMTRKLEEALLRTAAMRGPSPAERAAQSPAAPLPGPAPSGGGEKTAANPAGDAPSAPVDPFEEEIRRLLGRDAPKA
jgi:flagellar protein FliO/FliZ